MELEKTINRLPASPGVYLFRDSDNSILYVGKAKNLKSRTKNYLNPSDTKTTAMVSLASTIEHRTTKTELDAMVLEAQLIETHQPPFNVLLKTGKPFLYLYFSTGTLPKLELKRGHAHIGKGKYIGPFAESAHARTLYSALLNAFNLRVCNRKISGGCLYYHMNRCAGTCKENFDIAAYKKRLQQAKSLCTRGPKKFMQKLKQKIKQHSNSLEFEKARPLSLLHTALAEALGPLHDAESVKSSSRTSDISHIWILGPASNVMFLLFAHQGHVKKQHIFFITNTQTDHPATTHNNNQKTHDPTVEIQSYHSHTTDRQHETSNCHPGHSNCHPGHSNCHPGLDPGSSSTVQTKKNSNFKVNNSYKVSLDSGSRPGVTSENNNVITNDIFLSYYRKLPPPQSIFINFNLDNIELIQSFLQTWHKKKQAISVVDTTHKSPPDNVALAIEMVHKEHERAVNSAGAIKNLLRLKKNIHSIDCFDISHQQGRQIVGSCIRFIDGNPDSTKFRHFKLRTVQSNNDYASLQEIVSRRYKTQTDLPNLILIDGGKGQLSAVQEVISNIPCAALAKREERIFAKTLPTTGKKLNLKTIEGALLTSLRDYAHHFAISYHRKLAAHSLL